MATYNPSLKGYIADVPRVIFKRCDGAKFYFDELTAATVSADIQTTEINAGWSLFPVAVLPGQSTFTMNFTSGKFDSSLFSMANKTKYAENASYVMSVGERHDLDANHSITLGETPIEGSVSIEGMEEASSTAAGKFVVDPSTKKVTFYESDNIEWVDVVYDYQTTVQEAIITNKEAAIGECVALWPVYGSGDDCSESDIIGYWIIKVFRARITTVPGMDTSYKSASTFQFELQALDAKRNDEGCYSTAFYRKSA